MGYLDNIDKQLADSNYILNSLKGFKKRKLKYINPQEDKRLLPSHLDKLAINKAKQLKKKENTEKYYKLKGKKPKVKKERKYKDRCPRTYKLYIESDWWNQRKNKYYQTHKRVCTSCGSFEHIVLHHLFYANYGNEKDIDLMPLCQSCHREFHSTCEVKKDLRGKTWKWLKSKK